MGIPWADYGKPYRGQPSILYRVAFTVADTETVATTDSYAGYGDPTGADGAVRPPDATITTDTPGSGASRLALLVGTTSRVSVDARPEMDDVAPAMPGNMAVSTATSSAATVTFVAPGDDGMVGKVRGYDIRYRAEEEITDDNFAQSMPVPFTVAPADAGQLQTLTLDNLLPETDYWIGIRAFDDCRNTSPLATVHITTAARRVGEVDACFIATAAYGSVMANDVEQLRRFRDRALRSTALGELAVETYYTFSPAVAGVIGESDVLRATARAVIAPIVHALTGSRSALRSTP
jgi:hypothetical protein